ncbi:hypothetical protein STPYR_10185 [uncultured Stenotrophomonas sp.]|uniref:Uncharacterized protein n=1 Tax=uncultured Stenotrophomonas sp. TaxID=165438 RepID=A0A1Y5Q375_9GAMM|nr:hypothetical protein STPYR_10185 [uncultured Stenotrophomonas sp.]
MIQSIIRKVANSSRNGTVIRIIEVSGRTKVDNLILQVAKSL